MENNSTKTEKNQTKCLKIGRPGGRGVARLLLRHGIAT